jgi:hypothetical protein
MDMGYYLYEYFAIEKRLRDIHRIGHFVKEQLGKKAIGRPVVDQYESAKQMAFEMMDQTKRIIAAQQYQRRNEELYKQRYIIDGQTF